jgi:NAD(P)-dependent dehydrogenase (short-subunit alcohol dehydrogenase family)
MQLAGKVAVVTGSGNGIGEAIARRFAAEGAHVVVTDIEAEAVDRVANELGTVGLAADITQASSVHDVADLARRTFGEIDVWHSNAGIAGPVQPGDLQSDEIWDLFWKLHVLAHRNAAREVLPSMVARGDGYLLNTASTVSISTQPDKVAYAVTKHAALALAEWLAVHNRPKGIKVSCFCPGPMLTRMLLSNDFPDDHPAITMALSPEQVAEVLVKGIAAERFLILTHAGDEQPLLAKGADYDAWLDTMATRIAPAVTDSDG